MSQKGIHSCIHGYRTHIYTTPNIMPGDIFIDNEMWVESFDCDCWIETGYIADWYATRYFWAEAPPDGSFIAHYLDTVPKSDIGEYGIYSIYETSKDTFRVSILNKTTNFQTTVNSGMWNPPRDFGYVQIGQELAGTKGAAAGFVLFLFNSWLDKAGNWHIETEGDPSPTSHNPPFAGWLITPAETPKDPMGGAFFTFCCLPP